MALSNKGERKLLVVVVEGCGEGRDEKKLSVKEKGGRGKEERSGGGLIEKRGNEKESGHERKLHPLQSPLFFKPLF